MGTVVDIPVLLGTAHIPGVPLSLPSVTDSVPAALSSPATKHSIVTTSHILFIKPPPSRPPFPLSPIFDQKCPPPLQNKSLVCELLHSVISVAFLGPNPSRYSSASKPSVGAETL